MGVLFLRQPTYFIGKRFGLLLVYFGHALQALAKITQSGHSLAKQTFTSWESVHHLRGRIEVK